jgi:hypothetical protein
VTPEAGAVADDITASRNGVVLGHVDASNATEAVADEPCYRRRRVPADERPSVETAPAERTCG